MVVKAESAGMSETAAAYGEAVEAARRNKKASRRQDDGTEFCGVRRRRSGKYGAQIWDGLRRANVWLGTFGSAEEAAGAFDAAVVELRGAAQTNFEIPAAVGVPGMVASSTVPPSVGAPAGMATPGVGGNLSFSTSNTEANSDDEETDDMGERGKRKRKRSWEGGAAAGAVSEETMRFFEGLMEQVMERQEAMQQRFLEAIEKREQDRVIREEAWRRQEMARLAREQEILAQQSAMAATRNAAVVSLIQRITGQTIPMPSIAATPIRFMPPPPPSSSRTHATPIAYAGAPPPSSQPPARAQPQPSPQQQKPPTMPRPPPPPQQQAVMVHQSSTDVVMTPAETQHDAPGFDMSEGGGGGPASSSRWTKAEVHALIQLRGNLDMPRKGPLWEEISAGMRRMGYSRSSKQCMVKWGSINAYFKKLKGANKKRPEDSKTWPYFHQLDSLYRYKAALGSPAGAGAGGAAAEHANAAPQDRVEAFTVAAPISQRAPQPHTGGSVAGNRIVFSEHMWHPAPIADDINAEHVQAIGLKQAPVAAMRRTAAARSDSRSGYRGVRPYCGRCLVQIREPGRPTTRQQLGIFDNVEEAARAYDAAALRLYGAAAKTNFEQPPSGATADDLPELPVRSSTISAPPAEWQQSDEFLKEMDFTDVVA